MTAFRTTALCGVGAAAFLAASTQTASAEAGRYQSGDIHNHTVCSDGSTSVDTLVTGALEYLDWFVMAGHSGDGNRDCRFNDTTQSDLPSGLPGVDRVLWSETIGNEAILGEQANGNPKSETGRMWRWQALSQFTHPDTVTDPAGPDQGGPLRDKPAFVGVEWVVPAHEHASVAVIGEQLPAESTLVAGALPNPAGSNALGLSHFEYCFARNSDDTSGGFFGTWRCEISEENNQKLIDRFTDFPDQGNPDYNGSLDPATGINIDDSFDHVKSVAAIYWLKENFPHASYAIAAHVERQGGFVVGQTRGYNVEHLRDWHTAGWDEAQRVNISFGFESQPGHQTAGDRGTYSAGRPSAGLYTYGGTGCYAAAEAALPGKNFDGSDLTDEQVAALGVSTTIPRERVVLCREGVRTMWDAMLSEGRRFFFSGSSDWHNRGSFGFNDHRSTLDFLPGEFQKNYTFIRTRNPDNPAQDIVESLQSGNSYVVNGDLVDWLDFRACYKGKCATMGGTLTVPTGADVQVFMRLRDPKGANHSQYTFPNPALLPLGINEPLNAPTLRQVDLVTGDVRSEGFYEPSDPEYFNPLAPESTVIAATFTAEGNGVGQFAWKGRGPWKRIAWTLEDVTGDKYIRARGTNLPAGTPNARDELGNPTRDDNRNLIACADPACPEHVEGVLSFDVEAWADLWFYANPIFIEVEESTAQAVPAPASRRR